MLLFLPRLNRPARQHAVREALADTMLNEGQRAAAALVLTTDTRVSAIQGSAGTGKTTMLSEARKRLSNTGRSFVPASECTYVMDVSKGSYHQGTGREAILIDVESSITRSEVKYVSRHNGRWGVRVTLRVKQDDGKWRVVQPVNRIEA